MGTQHQSREAMGEKNLNVCSLFVVAHGQPHQKAGGKEVWVM
jgi:hypothetical protein